MFYPNEGDGSVTPLDAARVNRTVFHNHSVHWYHITLIRVGIILSTISILLKSIVFMFTDGVKFNTSVLFLTKIVVACHIYSWFLSMWWVLSLSILFTPCIIPTFGRWTWCVPIILLSIRYMCACRSPIYWCLSGTPFVLIIFHNITTLLLLFCTWYTVS